MTYYIKMGSALKIASEDALKVSERLPVGTWTVKQDPMTGEFFLEPIADYEFSGKVYGNANRMTDRILNTFADRDKETGVLLAGEQGSGKTLQAKLLTIEGRKRGIPTISINEPWHGEVFNAFIQSIDDPAIIFFDEFEKVYDKDEQEQILTLLDGAYPSKKLYVLTCNDTYRINQHMQNRPGRIYYRLDYQGLDSDFIEEYCLENLIDNSQTSDVVRVAAFFSEFNFDMLKATVEEMNRYGESVLDVMKVINAKPQDSNDTSYEFELSVKGNKISPELFLDKEWHGNPLSDDIRLMYEEEGKPYQRVKFSLRDMVKHDKGVFHFKNHQGHTLSLQKTKPVGWSMENYLV